MKILHKSASLQRTVQDSPSVIDLIQWLYNLKSIGIESMLSMYSSLFSESRTLNKNIPFGFHSKVQDHTVRQDVASELCNIDTYFIE